MLKPLLAIGWEELFGVVAFVISGLFWVISHFAAQAKPKGPPPRRPVAGPQPAAGAPRPNDPLQTEIDEFLRQAQARREGKPAPPQPRAPVAQAPPRREPPQTGRGESDRNRPPKKTIVGFPKRSSRRPESGPPSRPIPVKLSQPEQPEKKRRSLAQESDSGEGDKKFAERAASLSRMQEESDAEFQSHMSRVFDRDVSKLKSAVGMFEAAGATAKAASLAAGAAAASASSQSSTAPSVARKQVSDIALFLAGRKNIRDAIILNEVLKRPEW